MKLSVIIPVYNAEKCIRRCLDSILDRILSDYEIICVDDGSTDNSLAILREYANKYNHIKVITQKNSFAGVARNHGLQYAQGKYIHFMDADDFVVGNYLRVLEMAEALDADYIKVKAEAIDMQTMESIENRQYSLSDVDNTYFHSSLPENISIPLMLKTAPTPWAAIVKKSYIDEAKLQFNNLRCSNDRSFFLKAITHTKKLAFCDELLVKHVVNNKDSLVGNRQLHFDCDIRSYEIVCEDVKTIPSELADLVLCNELNNLISWYRKLDAERKELHKEMFREHLDIEVLRQFELKTLCSEWMKPVWEVLNMDALQLIDYELVSLEQMKTQVEDSKELIIYGAGRAANALIQYVDNVLDMKEKIKYILVKDTSKNPETIEGIPVYQLGTRAVDNYATVLVAAFEKAHRGIVRDLIWADYTDFKAVTDGVYNQIWHQIN